MVDRGGLYRSRGSVWLGAGLGALLSNHLHEVEDIFVLVLDVSLLEVHLALVQKVVHILVPQIPLQEPPEYALQPDLLLIAARQQLLQVSQTDHHFLQNGLNEFYQLLVADLPPLAPSPQ